ncbi:uncharacterized protein LOC126846949 [Adelges cooleyi]|uniref:uncharacterized protein LOC126846949 n=1 Tax=Adelges cooleyi TaxID=133065 RepID=UPI00217FD28F|nr:uncharacterized protein LOC126846949 [Adelges cooleyi]
MEAERVAHGRLCDLVGDVRTAFGPNLMVYLLFLFLEHLARFYSLAYLKWANHSATGANGIEALEPLLFLAHAWTGMFLVANLAHKLTEISKEIMVDLRSISIQKLPQECVDQVSFFMCQIEHSNTEINVLDLFKVNKTMLTSIGLVLATYIIVLVQLSSNIKSIFANIGVHNSCIILYYTRHGS